MSGGLIPLRVRLRAAWHRRPWHGCEGFWNTRQGIHCSGCGRNIARDWQPHLATHREA